MDKKSRGASRTDLLHGFIIDSSSYQTDSRTAVPSHRPLRAGEFTLLGQALHEAHEDGGDLRAGSAADRKSVV